MKINTKKPICCNCGAEGRDLYNDPNSLIIRFCPSCESLKFYRRQATALTTATPRQLDRWDFYARLEGFKAGVADSGIRDKSLLFPPALGGAQ